MNDYISDENRAAANKLISGLTTKVELNYIQSLVHERWHEITREEMSKCTFKIGDVVKFSYKCRTVIGDVVKKNISRIQVKTEKGIWNVPVSKLSLV